MTEAQWQMLKVLDRIRCWATIENICALRYSKPSKKQHGSIAVTCSVLMQLGYAEAADYRTHYRITKHGRQLVKEAQHASNCMTTANIRALSPTAGRTIPRGVSECPSERE